MSRFNNDRSNGEDDFKKLLKRKKILSTISILCVFGMVCLYVVTLTVFTPGAKWYSVLLLTFVIGMPIWITCIFTFSLSRAVLKLWHVNHDYLYVWTKNGCIKYSSEDIKKVELFSMKTREEYGDLPHSISLKLPALTTTRVHSSSSPAGSRYVSSHQRSSFFVTLKNNKKIRSKTGEKNVSLLINGWIEFFSNSEGEKIKAEEYKKHESMNVGSVIK